MIISDKKNLVQDNTKSKGDRKASRGFKHKIASFKKVTFINSRCLLLLLLHRLKVIIPPPTPTPPKKKIAKICHFVSLKTFMKTVQNWLLSSKICLENFRRIGFF